MKRVKCYGRMKTTCINTAVRKVFYGDNEPSLWDISFGDDDFIPSKEPKKTPCFQKEADSVVDHPKSPDFFSSCEYKTDKNKENKAPAKPKPKKKRKGKKTVKKTKAQVTKAEPPIKEPRWSIIYEHELHVEGNCKRRAIPASSSPSKQSFTASNEENKLINDEPSAKKIMSNANVMSKAVEGSSGLRLRSVNHASDIVQQAEQRPSSKRARSKPVVSRKVGSGCRMGLRSLRRTSVVKSHQSSVRKNSLIHNSADIVEISSRSEICMSADESVSNVTTNTNKSLVNHASNSINQSSIPEVSPNCSLVSIAGVSRRSELRSEISRVDAESVMMPNTDTCRTSNVINRNSALKDSMNSNFSEITEILPTNDIPTEMSDCNPLNIMNQNSALIDSVNCNFSGMTEILPANEIPIEMSDSETDVSDAMIHTEKQSHSPLVSSPALDPAVNVSFNTSKEERAAREKGNNCTDLAEKSFSFIKPKKWRDDRLSTSDTFGIQKSSSMWSKIFETTNRSSRSKNCLIMTSTPTINSRMRLPQKMSMFNLSRICTPEMDDGLPRRSNPIVSKSSIYIRSGMYDNAASVSVVAKKARSLDLQKDSIAHSHFSSLSQTRPGLKSNKSCSCIEKVASNKSLIPYSDVNQSQSVIEKLLEVCEQEAIKPFAEAYDWNLFKVQKVGEGTYGEVFMLSLKKKASVIKIIPVSQDAADSWMNIETVYSEVKVCQCLSKLRDNSLNKTSNFNKLNSVHFVKGCYPAKLLTAWDTFCTVKSSYNIRPDCFDREQCYVILDMENGGTDMASFVMKNAAEAESILKQVTISLAIAEETHLFEHRDLHLGNILVQRTKKKSVSYVLRGQSISIPSHGVMVTIIDFTLSRIFESGCVYYNDLADDKSLFDQSGDYQFEIYRATRDHLKNQWQEGSLFSNVLWLTFLCVKITEYHYVRPTSIMHLKSINNILAFQTNLKSCKSAFDCLTVCKILLSVPKSNQSVDSILKGKAVFVDRKSFQKSKCSIIRN